MIGSMRRTLLGLLVWLVILGALPALLTGSTLSGGQ